MASPIHPQDGERLTGVAAPPLRLSPSSHQHEHAPRSTPLRTQQPYPVPSAAFADDTVATTADNSIHYSADAAANAADVIASTTYQFPICLGPWFCVCYVKVLHPTIQLFVSNYFEK